MRQADQEDEGNNPPVVLITGAAGGIGLATARRFLKDGALVALADIRGDIGRGLAERLGDKARFFALDITSEAGWKDCIASIIDWAGRLNTLVNNAGVSLSDKLDELEFETWRKVLNVNLDGVFLGCRHAMPELARSPGGSIVNVASVWGLKPHAHRLAYSSSKAGVTMLTKSLALYCAEAGSGVRVNSVHPGGVMTDMVTKQIPKDASAREAALSAIGAAHPLGFLADPDDIANAIAFLCGPEARFITGAELAVDGGLSL